MSKSKRPHRRPAPRKKPTKLEIAEHTIETLAKRDHTTPDMVRKHIQLGLINGLVSDDPQTRAAWEKIPRAGEVPTPEEVIACFAGRLTRQKNG